MYQLHFNFYHIILSLSIVLAQVVDFLPYVADLSLEYIVLLLYNNSTAELKYAAKSGIIPKKGGGIMTDWQANLAAMVKRKRQGMGMSQEQLAEKVEKTAGFIGQLERGEAKPSLDTLRALIQSLGMDANAIFTGSMAADEDCQEIISLMLQMRPEKRALLLEFSRLLYNSDL